MLARTQFIVLLGVLVVRRGRRGDDGRERPRGAPANLWRTRRPFVVLFGALLVVVLGAIAIGKGSQLLGSYSVTAEHVRLDFGLFQLAFEHVALLALGLAILPCVVGVGRLVDRVRPSALESGTVPSPSSAAPQRVLVKLQVGLVQGERFGAGLVKDRYLFYVVPVVWSGCRRGGVALDPAQSRSRSSVSPRWSSIGRPAIVKTKIFLTFLPALSAMRTKTSS